MNKISPVSRSKSQAKENYDRLSGIYDLIAGPSEKKFKDMGLKMFDAKNGEFILEIGYGTGYCLTELAKAVGADGSVFGIELSEKMEGNAKTKTAKLNLSDRVNFEIGDAVNLPYGDEMFDGIFMSFVLELFDTGEIPEILKECSRALKPGGRIGIVFLSREVYPSLPLKIYEWAHLKFPVFLDCRPIYGKEDLKAAGYNIKMRELKTMWGLPVEIVLGVNKNI